MTFEFDHLFICTDIGADAAVDIQTVNLDLAYGGADFSGFYQPDPYQPAVGTNVAIR